MGFQFISPSRRKVVPRTIVVPIVGFAWNPPERRYRVARKIQCSQSYLRGRGRKPIGASSRRMDRVLEDRRLNAPRIDKRAFAERLWISSAIRRRARRRGMRKVKPAPWNRRRNSILFVRYPGELFRKIIVLKPRRRKTKTRLISRKKIPLLNLFIGINYLKNVYKNKLFIYFKTGLFYISEISKKICLYLWNVKKICILYNYTNIAIYTMLLQKNFLKQINVILSN